MDTATEDNNNGKRVRFNAQASTPASSSPSTAISCAKFSASIVIASLPDAIKPLAEHCFTKFLTAKVELHKLAKSKARLANTDFVPTSARFNFKLNATTRVKEQAAAAYETLANDCTYISDIFKADIKKRVVRLVDLEIKIASELMQHEFCTAISSLGTAISLHKFGVDTASIKAKNLIFSTIETHEELIKHFPMINVTDGEHSDLQVFFQEFKISTNDPDEVHMVGSLDEAYSEAVASAVPDYKCLLEALFVRSWDTYLSRTAELARQLEVKTFVEASMRENATADVAMELEEITINSQKLGDLVQSKITEGTRKLTAKIARLEKAVPKNKQGAQKSGASNTNKNKKDQKTPKKKQGADAPKAAVADKDSTAAKGKAKANSGANKTKQKKRRNNRKPRTSS